MERNLAYWKARELDARIMIKDMKSCANYAKKRRIAIESGIGLEQMTKLQKGKV